VQCAVPAVARQALATAEAALAANHCTVGAITRKYSKTIAKGRVISQSVAPGAQLPANTRVNLVVSKGKAPAPKVTLCYKHHTVKVTKAKAKALRRHGAKLGACKKPKKHR
jgi:beta-lactam-binding protein with PASTA domain